MGMLDVHTSLAGQSPEEKVKSTTRAVESMVLKQVLQSSGAFKGSSMAGGAMVADLFADTLADAVSKSGGLGLADTLQKQLLPQTGSAPTAGLLSAALQAPSTAPLNTPSTTDDLLPMRSSGASVGVKTSGYGTRADPFTGEQKEHHGVDLAAPTGTPIHAALGGVVVQAGPRGGYGNAVEVDSGHGVHTVYAHASAVHVTVGQQIQSGDTVADVGATGRATGPHLHFEVRVKGRAVDPERALKTYGESAEEILSGSRRG